MGKRKKSFHPDFTHLSFSTHSFTLLHVLFAHAARTSQAGRSLAGRYAITKLKYEKKNEKFT